MNNFFYRKINGEYKYQYKKILLFTPVLVFGRDGFYNSVTVEEFNIKTALDIISIQAHKPVVEPRTVDIYRLKTYVRDSKNDIHRCIHPRVQHCIF